MQQDDLPVFFLSHGGGPWPYVEAMRKQFSLTEQFLKKIPALLPHSPSAILVITGHWEEKNFTVSTGTHPPTLYDYSGFPEHTYHIQYPAPGLPSLAHRVQDLLLQKGISSVQDSKRGFDHGTFVPLALMYPEATIPVVLLSIKNSYDPLIHIQVGEALQPLRREGVLILGSGLTYHNMRGFGHPHSMASSEQFEEYLYDAISQPTPQQRTEKLIAWEKAPAARQVHPREDHLIPLMVIAGAAGKNIGKRYFVEIAMGVKMASYSFGTLKT
ncbi:MAG: class III extradiol ring-cleavage dioxygenase [Pseudomonadota bacterium]